MLRVVELAEGVPGAVCGRLLAGLGHDVVKCEPAGGDRLRRVDDGALFAELNAGKRGLLAGDGLLPHLGAADIVIVDGGPGLGDFAAPRLRDQFPQLIVVATTAAGLDAGPDLTGCDSLLAEAAGGLAHMIGEPDRAPLSLGGEQAGYATGVVAFFGAMLAVHMRTRTGVGELVDVAANDVVAYSDWKSDTRYRESGVAPVRSGAKAGRWRMVRALDGWVGVIFEPSQWPAVVDLVGDVRLQDPALEDDAVRRDRPDAWWPVVEEWCAARPKLEVYGQAQRRGLPFGHVVTLEEIADVGQFRARGFVPGADPGSVLGAPFGPGGLAWMSPPAPRLGEHQHELATLWPLREWTAPTATPDRRPLGGLIVVDLGTITAGAAAGRMLADYGATVIKVESPDRPDAFRKWIVDSEASSHDPDAIAPMFDSNNAGKLALSVDLKTAAGLADFHRVVEQADVLIENFGVGVTERLGIDWGTLRAINPRLVYVSLSSQGQTGPESASRSYGSTLDLLSGLASVTGYDAEHPMWSSVAVNYPDQLASLFGAALAVYCTATGHRGIHVDLAQRELVTWTLAAELRAAAESGVPAVPTGNRRATGDPHDVFPCAGADAWVAVSCRTAEQRAALARLIGDHPGELAEALQQWTAARTPDAAVKELTASGVPAAPVATAETRAADVRFTAREVFLGDGPRRIKGFPLVLQGYRPPIPRRAPRLGAHTRLVLETMFPPADPP